MVFMAGSGHASSVGLWGSISRVRNQVGFGVCRSHHYLRMSVFEFLGSGLLRAGTGVSEGFSGLLLCPQLLSHPHMPAPPSAMDRCCLPCAGRLLKGQDTQWGWAEDVCVCYPGSALVLDNIPRARVRLSPHSL